MQLLIDHAEQVKFISLRTGLLSDKEFNRLAGRYPDYRVKLLADGEVTILPPSAGVGQGWRFPRLVN